MWWGTGARKDTYTVCNVTVICATESPDNRRRFKIALLAILTLWATAVPAARRGLPGWGLGIASVLCSFSASRYATHSGLGCRLPSCECSHNSVGTARPRVGSCQPSTWAVRLAHRADLPFLMPDACAIANYQLLLCRFAAADPWRVPGTAHRREAGRRYRRFWQLWALRPRASSSTKLHLCCLFRAARSGNLSRVPVSERGNYLVALGTPSRTISACCFSTGWWLCRDATVWVGGWMAVRPPLRS